jgi:hypothetical protein
MARTQRPRRREVSALGSNCREGSFPNGEDQEKRQMPRRHGERYDTPRGHVVSAAGGLCSLLGCDLLMSLLVMPGRGSNVGTLGIVCRRANGLLIRLLWCGMPVGRATGVPSDDRITSPQM